MEVKLNLIQLLEEDGFSFERMAATNGGEHKGPCPFCGGDDRFCVWPKLDKNGRYWCRQCERNGDAIQYLRDFRKMTFKMACRHLSIKPALFDKKSSRKSSTIWSPKEMVIPTIEWQNSAMSFLSRAVDRLWEDEQIAVRRWLNKRGLNDKTIRRAHLGWHPKDVWVARHLWGLEENISQGKRKKLWLPAGLIIPQIYKGEIIRLRVRRFECSDNWGRYIVISGSATGPMRLSAIEGVYLVVESELDALLLTQYTSKLTSIIATGSAQSKPDSKLHVELQKARLILVALDSDLAGAKQTSQWWLKKYNNAVWWPIPLQYGKDPGEAFEGGLDLGHWVKAALDRYPK
jgi:hypothetical protein